MPNTVGADACIGPQAGNARFYKQNAKNGSWAPTAARVMRKMFEASKNLTILDETVTVKGSLDDASTAQLHALADALSK